MWKLSNNLRSNWTSIIASNRTEPHARCLCFARCPTLILSIPPLAIISFVPASAASTSQLQYQRWLDVEFKPRCTEQEQGHEKLEVRSEFLIHVCIWHYMSQVEIETVRISRELYNLKWRHNNNYLPMKKHRWLRLEIRAIALEMYTRTQTKKRWWAGSCSQVILPHKNGWTSAVELYTSVKNQQLIVC